MLLVITEGLRVVQRLVGFKVVDNPRQPTVLHHHKKLWRSEIHPQLYILELLYVPLPQWFSLFLPSFNLHIAS